MHDDDGERRRVHDEVMAKHMAWREENQPPQDEARAKSLAETDAITPDTFKDRKYQIGPSLAKKLS